MDATTSKKESLGTTGPSASLAGHTRREALIPG